MTVKVLTIFLFALAFGTIILLPSFASSYALQTPADSNSTVSTPENPIQALTGITVTTDKTTYNQGDTITITGSVSQLDPSTAVTLRVFNSLKNSIAVAQFHPSSDKSFTRTFLASGPLWAYSGIYTIVAQYGPTTTVNTLFNYIGSSSPPSPSSPISPLNPNSNTTNPTLTPTTPPTTTPPTTTTPSTSVSSNPNANSTSSTQLSPSTTTSKIPHWVKSLFGLYGQGQVSDDDLISALKFLIRTGVIKVS